MRQNGSEFVATVSGFFSALGPTGQIWYLSIQIALFYLMLVLVIFAYWNEKQIFPRPLKYIKWANSKWFFASLIFVFVLMGRFPTAIYGYQNPDECLWIACAKVLIKEPKPWVVCDTSTSGPIVVLPMVLLNFFGIPIDVGSAKLASALTLGLALVFIFLTLDNLLGKILSRIIMITLAVAVSIAMVHFWDYLVYNGEQMPVLLMSIASYVLSEIIVREKIKLVHVFIAGICLGMVPYAKLQGVPLALTISVCAGIYLLYRFRFKYIFYFGLAGIIPSVIFLSWIKIGGGFQYFLDSYIFANIAYANEENPGNTSFWDMIVFAWRLLFDTREARPFYELSIGLCLFSFIFLNYRNVLKHSREMMLTLTSLLFFTISLLCIGQPFRDHLHYTYFASFTTPLATGSVLLLLNNACAEEDLIMFSRAKIMMFAIVLGFNIFYFHEYFTLHPVYNIYAESVRHGSVNHPEVVKAINKYSKPGDGLTVWGWSSTFYSDTDLIMGTRYADTSGMLRENPSQIFFLKNYILDLKRNNPKIFLDAVTLGSFRYSDRKLYGFRVFPEVREFVDSNYKMMEDVNGFHVYVHN